MTLAFKLILLISFIGLVVIVAKNRLSNPQVRIQFREDLEMNKKRLRSLGRVFPGLLNNILPLITRAAKAILPYVSQATHFVFEKMKTGAQKAKTTLAVQAKELREDMKSLEIPGHKKDFFEKLEKQEESEPVPPSVPKRSLGERFFARSFLSAPKEVEEEPQEPLREAPIVREHKVHGFQVSEIKESRAAVELEIDKTILMKKEKWLLYAIAKNPKNANFYKKLGRIYLQLNNREDARNCFEYAVRLGSQDPEVRSLLSQLRHSV